MLASSVAVGATGPSWTSLSADRPVAWHTERCVDDWVVERLLELSNATLPTHPRTYTGAARIHSVVAQGDPAARAVRRVLTQRAGLPLRNAEPLFVLEYVEGHRCGLGQAMPHFDWNCVEGSTSAHDDGAEACPQLRLVTSLLYLNDVPDEWGGGTRLPRAGLRASAQRGACLLWFNARRDRRGRLVKDDKAQHQGECVRAPTGVPATPASSPLRRKFVLVQWIRASELEDLNEGLCEEDPGSCIVYRALKEALANEEGEGAGEDEGRGRGRAVDEL